MENRASSSLQVIRVQLVDDHDVVRAGFRHLLELEDSMDIRVVSESGDGDEAVHDYMKHKPDIVIMDISMSRMSGLEASRRILVKNPQARIIFLSMMGTDAATKAMQAGARAFLSKQSAPEELIQAIRRVMLGRKYIDARTAEQLALERFEEKCDPLNLLTPRQYEILLQLMDGKPTDQIAKQLFLSPKTVRNHKAQIMERFGVSNTFELATFAIRAGLVKDK